MQEQSIFVFVFCVSVPNFIIVSTKIMEIFTKRGKVPLTAAIPIILIYLVCNLLDVHICSLVLFNYASNLGRLLMYSKVEGSWKLIDFSFWCIFTFSSSFYGEMCDLPGTTLMLIIISCQLLDCTCEEKKICDYLFPWGRMKLNIVHRMNEIWKERRSVPFYHKELVFESEWHA